MESSKCKICEADFRLSALKDGKCSVCVREHPNEKSLAEVLSKVKVPNKMGDELDENRVRVVVGEMLDERIKPILDKLDAALEPEPKRGPGRPKKETI